ncbi:uncharacterized protein BO80DRAFT_449882 [Aspergillus ibericus CBS 121593]|uniref:Uncharacterized protein n=1 Tax=Aspergillus ibericus CBS 121593 TaxID=1448316 RepID=A0A395GJU5_9EURO|nr:hypothetical protein BO80DRAFT_449882 [Aspergillus ibericus CBS 121593]RAK95765.1 hypothetical protein BO80DRAFT_449882 [Aspergillus ibericus CBS 121593]
MDEIPAREASGDTDPLPDKETSPQTENAVLKNRVADLEQKVATLQDVANIDRKEYGRQLRILRSVGFAWLSCVPQDMSQELDGVLFSAQTWCQSYALRKLVDLAELSADDKQGILDRLAGYWVQDLDWDTLMGSFPYPIRRNVLNLVAQTMLTKDLMERFFENPFWFIEGDTDQHDEIESSISCAQRLQHLYQQFLKTNPLRASRRKTETVRLSHSTLPNQATDLELCQQTQKRREEAVSSFTSAMLSSRPFQMLLRDVKPEQAEEREKALLEVYRFADQAAFTLGSNYGSYQYKTLASLGATLNRTSELVVTQTKHRTPENEEDPSLDGRRILGILNPAVEAFDLGDNLQHAVLAKAQVLLEHHELTQERYEEARRQFVEKAREEAREEPEEPAIKKKKKNGKSA